MDLESVDKSLKAESQFENIVSKLIKPSRTFPMPSPEVQNAFLTVWKYLKSISEVEVKDSDECTEQDEDDETLTNDSGGKNASLNTEDPYATVKIENNAEQISILKRGLFHHGQMKSANSPEVPASRISLSSENCAPSGGATPEQRSAPKHGRRPKSLDLIKHVPSASATICSSTPKRHEEQERMEAKQREAADVRTCSGSGGSQKKTRKDDDIPNGTKIQTDDKKKGIAEEARGCLKDNVMMIDNEYRYTAGCLVWAHINGYPWWPAIVDYDPDCEQYSWSDDGTTKPAQYHVVFLGKPVSRAWVVTDKLRPFVDKEENLKVKEQSRTRRLWARRLQVAKRNAEIASGMDQANRLRIYGFLARYNKEVINSAQKAAEESSSKQRQRLPKRKLLSLSQDVADSFIEMFSSDEE